MSRYKVGKKVLHVHIEEAKKSKRPFFRYLCRGEKWDGSRLVVGIGLHYKCLCPLIFTLALTNF